MISPKKLIKMARKWQRIAALGRKRIASSRTNNNVDAESCSSSVADKGHFVVYTADQRHFVIPLVYLSNNIFRGLFKMSEEEFGLPCDESISLPCDSVFMEYIIPLIQSVSLNHLFNQESKSKQGENKKKRKTEQNKGSPDFVWFGKLAYIHLREHILFIEHQDCFEHYTRSLPLAYCFLTQAPSLFPSCFFPHSPS